MRCKLPEKQTMKYKKGLWSPDEDQKLTHYVMSYGGHGSWSSVPVNAGLQRNGKSCRLRWINYLRPGLRRGPFSSKEEETIVTLHGLLGNKWSQIAQHLPGRTDNEIKNYWHSHLRKKVDKSKHLLVNQNLASKEPSSSNLHTCNFTNSSSAYIAQSVTPVSQISNLPTILFSDWISLDDFQQEIGMQINQPVSHSLNPQLSTGVEHEWQQDDKGSTFDSGSYENKLHTQMTSDQKFEFNDEDFDINNFICM